MRFNNTDNDALGKKDDIYSPTVNFPTGTVNPRIKFDVAYAPYVDGFGQINDTLEVLLFDVCAQTSTSIYKKWQELGFAGQEHLLKAVHLYQLLTNGEKIR